MDCSLILIKDICNFFLCGVHRNRVKLSIYFIQFERQGFLLKELDEELIINLFVFSLLLEKTNYILDHRWQEIVIILRECCELFNQLFVPIYENLLGITLSSNLKGLRARLILLKRNGQRKFLIMLIILIIRIILLQL